MSDAPYMHMLSTSVDSVHTIFEVRYLLSEQRRHCWLQTQIILCCRVATGHAALLQDPKVHLFALAAVLSEDAVLTYLYKGAMSTQKGTFWRSAAVWTNSSTC
jgi:hypothetical protein